MRSFLRCIFARELKSNKPNYFAYYLIANRINEDKFKMVHFTNTNTTDSRYLHRIAANSVKYHVNACVYVDRIMFPRNRRAIPSRIKPQRELYLDLDDG